MSILIVNEFIKLHFEGLLILVCVVFTYVQFYMNAIKQ